MSLPDLDNLVRTGLLKDEPADPHELDGLLRSGRARLADAGKEGLSDESRFDLAYNAVHSLALAALRWHGYRPNRQRFVVFQSLVHTLGISTETMRILDKCHGRRNLAEYEGIFDVDTRLLAELLASARSVQAAVETLGGVTRRGGKKKT